MTELVYERLKENLDSLKLRNTLEILDNYLERAIKDDLNIVTVPDHIFAEEARSKRNRAYEKQVQLSGFPIKKTLAEFDFTFQPSIDKRQIEELATMRFMENAENIVFLGPPGVGKTHLATALGLEAARSRFSTYYINCHTLIEQLKKAHFENRLQDRLKIFSRYRLLIIDEIGYLPMDIQGANLFFQLIASAMKRLLPSSLQTRPFPSGMKSLRRLQLLPPSSTGCCTTAPSSTSRATVTGLKSAKSI